MKGPANPREPGVKRRSRAIPRSGPDVVRHLLQRLQEQSAAELGFLEFCEEPERFGPEVAGAAVLFGFALASREGLLQRLENAAPVVIVEVPHAEWIEPMGMALEACFGSAPTRPGNWRKDRPKLQEGRRAIVVEAVAGRIHPVSRSDGGTAKAFREHRPLIGVLAGQHTGLPVDLLETCEERIVVGGLDPEGVEFVVDHVVGGIARRRLTAGTAAAVGPRDLRAAIHRARGAEGSIDRLAAMVERRLERCRAADGLRLQDLAGYGPAAEWGLAAAADLSAYSRNRISWSACEPGVLLAGKPGTGKTSFARALACQAGVPLLAGSLAQWQSAGEAHLGTTLAAMRGFFETARKASPCVALIDELDSFGDRRHFSGHNRAYSVQVVNGLLECLDGAGGHAGVLLVGTTNHPDRIDPAILRSGRFDRCFTIPLPTISDLSAILRQHLGTDLADADLTDMARRALGGTGADCAAWVRRARGRARRADRMLALGDLLFEIDASAPSRGEAEDARLATHESGHAVVAHALGFELQAIVLHRSAEGGGSTSFRLPDRYATRANLLDLLAVYLAGRAAEVLVHGAASTGAAADLSDATAICRHMHCSWGLGSRIAVSPPSSMPAKVSALVERDLRRASDAATCILVERRRCLDALASTLTQRRSLDSAEMEAILQPPVESAGAGTAVPDDESTVGLSRRPKPGRGKVVSARMHADGGASPCRS